MPSTIAIAADDFLVSLRAKSDRTRTTYATGLRRFLGWFRGAVGDPDALSLDRMAPEDLEQFYLALVDELGRDREATINTYLAGARAFVRHCVRSGRLPGGSLERATERLNAVKAKPIYRTPRVDSALALIVDYVKNEVPAAIGAEADRAAQLRLLRDRALLHVLYCTGIRRSEAARLDRADVDDGRARQALITGKGRRERVIFFDDDARRVVREYLAARADTYAPLFIRHRGSPRDPGRAGERLRLSPQSVWKIVKRYSGLVGVPATTHDFRHLKATTLLNRGANLSEVQDILGHASPDTTKRIYAHYETEKLREAFDRYSVPVEEAAASVRRSRSGA